jgi:hypothetical protein
VTLKKPKPKPKKSKKEAPIYQTDTCTVYEDLARVQIKCENSKSDFQTLLIVFNQDALLIIDTYDSLKNTKQVSLSSLVGV